MTTKLLAIIALVLFVAIAAGLLWLAVQTDNVVSVALSYAAGLSMIFLPCTLPLVFVIVPLALRESSPNEEQEQNGVPIRRSLGAGGSARPGKGLGIAIAFGLGLAVTLAFYGIVTALLGGYFGLDQFTRAMFIVAGAMALVFALTELNLVRIPLPVFTHHVPAWTQGYGKSFLLGLFLGNAGIGCPNPAFYVLLTYIASTGSIVTGGWLGLVHGVGRATPLILLVLLALLGVRGLGWMRNVSGKIHIWTGVALVVAGAFILTYGLVGMQWWEDSVFHAGWNQLVLTIAPNLAEAPGHPVAEGVAEAPFFFGWWLLVAVIMIPLFWYTVKYGVQRSRLWAATLVLVVLGTLASLGITEVEHGHGVEQTDNHPHSPDIEEHHPHP